MRASARVPRVRHSTITERLADIGHELEVLRIQREAFISSRRHPLVRIVERKIARLAEAQKRLNAISPYAND